MASWLHRISSAGSPLFIRIGASLLMLGNYAFLALALTPRELGNVFIVTGLGQALATIVTLGLPDAVLKTSAEAEAGANHSVLATTWKALVAIGLLYLLILALLMSPLSQSAALLQAEASVPHAALLTWFVMLGHGLSLSISQLLLAAQKRDVSVFVYYGSGPVGLSAGLLLGHAIGVAWTATDVVIILGAALTLISLAAAARLWRRIPNFWRQGDAVNFSRLLKLGMPMMGTRLVGLLEAWGPIWIVGLLVSSAAAAAVGVAIRFLAGLLSLTQVVSFISRPIVAGIVARGDRETLISYSRFIATLLGCSMALLSLTMWVEGHTILKFFFGAEYYAAGWILAIFSVGYSAQWLVGNIDLALMMGGHHRRLFVVNALGAVLLFAGMAVGTLAGGVHATAVVFSLYSFVKFFLLAAIARKTYGFWSVPTASRVHLSRGFDLLTRPAVAAR
jgi:O-antigen/teichoic acid export membrane protein